MPAGKRLSSSVMRFESPARLLFIGDSITDCGRDRSANGTDLGNGWVAQSRALIEAHHPERRYEYLNLGIGGNRITDLEARWEADVLERRPDVLMVMIGINDVWRQFDRPWLPQVSLEDYSLTLERLLERSRPVVRETVLLSPYFLETNRQDPMRERMDAYGAAMRALAKRQGHCFVDVQAAFDRWLAHHPTQRLCADRVHPNATGHALIAAAFLDAVGFSWRTA